MDTLGSRLTYEPRELKFGTSGRRGEVVHLTQLEVYLNVRAELQYLQALPVGEGGIQRGDEFYFACDLRPSSDRFVAAQGGRGEIAQAVERAIRDAGMLPVNLGRIPTPALASYAISRNSGSVMITGSHIPFDRNGYKTNTSRGELLKEQEEPIGREVRRVREQTYGQPFAESLFDERGFLKSGHGELCAESDRAKAAYVERYTSFFEGLTLDEKRILVYQHSAVGRDLLVEILTRLGAEAIPSGRSETFVPIDTENIDEAQLAAIQRLADEEVAKGGPIWAVVSTDGDSDRPLILGPEEKTGRLRFFGGDLVGMVVAEYFGADAVVVPITCNDAIDRGKLAPVLEPKTRVGSPYVIAGMEQAHRKGRRVVCGWEANGGFLTGSALVREGRTLSALPTRDAVLPILGALFSAHTEGLSLAARFDRLPARYSRAALLKEFPRPVALEILKRFSPSDATPTAELQSFFPARMGLGTILRLNYVDGLRIIFANGEVVHLRPSGNADEFRIYAVADTQARADAIAKMGVAEPDGILRSMERAVAGGGRL